MFFEEMCKVMEDLREESFAEGQEEGRREQAQMTARNLSVQGLSVEQIAQAVGFRVEEPGKAFYFLRVRFIV